MTYGCLSTRHPRLRNPTPPESHGISNRSAALAVPFRTKEKRPRRRHVGHDVKQVRVDVLTSLLVTLLGRAPRLVGVHVPLRRAFDDRGDAARAVVENASVETPVVVVVADRAHEDTAPAGERDAASGCASPHRPPQVVLHAAGARRAASAASRGWPRPGSPSQRSCAHVRPDAARRCRVVGAAASSRRGRREARGGPQAVRQAAEGDRRAPLRRNSAVAARGGVRKDPARRMHYCLS